MSLKDEKREEHNKKCVSVATLQNHISKVSPLLLEIEPEEENAFRQMLETMNSQQILHAFSQGEEAPVLLLKKRITQPQIEANNNKIARQVSFDLSLGFVASEDHGEDDLCIAFFKKSPQSHLAEEHSLVSQLSVLNIDLRNSFEALHNYVRHGFVPLIKSQNVSGSSSGSSSKKETELQQKIPTGFSLVNQKLSELEISLQHIRQNLQIPTVVLNFHEKIIQAQQVAAKNSRHLKPEDLEENLQTSEQFLNTLQSGVNRWIKDIQTVTKLERIETMDSTSNTLTEINFWGQLEIELKRIQGQLELPEAECTLSLLKQKKRFITTVAFETDTIGLKKALEKVNSYKPVVNELDKPLKDLFSADLSQVSPILHQIFDHLTRSSKKSGYPIERFLNLIQALSRDVTFRMLEILKAQRLLLLPYEDFDSVSRQAVQVFIDWDEKLHEFRNVTLPQVAEKRGLGKIATRIRVQDFIELRNRLNSIREFRKQHHELKTVLLHVQATDSTAMAEISQAYEFLQESPDIFVFSKEAVQNWERAMKKYEEHIYRVESHITNILRDKLATAKNANEMFRVFSKFNALFVRKRIRDAIQEYQTQLIEKVKQDIMGLHDKFKRKYPKSEAAALSNVRDFPPVSGVIIWTKQLERQLNLYLQRVEDILGKGWEFDVEGGQLKQIGDNFRQKLKADEIFETWVRDTETRSIEISGPLLTVSKKQNRFVLGINFDDHVITLFKEVRNLQWLNFKVPKQISSLSNRVKDVYPIAVSLKESIRTYTQTTLRVTPAIAPLVAAHKAEAQSLLHEGFSLHWEALSKLDRYTKALAEKVLVFQEKVDEVSRKAEKVQVCLESLKTCPFSTSAFGTTLTTLQQCIDELAWSDYSNLSTWVAAQGADIEEILLGRLKQALLAWIEAFEEASDPHSHNNSNNNNNNNENNNESSNIHRRAPATRTLVSDPEVAAHLRPQLNPSVHEIAIRNQAIAIEPPIAQARESWLGQLHSWLGVVCGLPRVRATRFRVQYQMQEFLDLDKQRAPKTYKALIGRLPVELLHRAYEAVERRFREAESYCGQWRSFQTLFAAAPAVVFGQVGEDLDRWTQVLQELRRERMMVDTSESQKRFGNVLVIDYAQVQLQVQNKYDFWHNDAISNFATLQNQAKTEFYETLKQAREELEGVAVEVTSTSEAVEFIIKIQNLKRNVEPWQKKVVSYGGAQELLRRSRFPFPPNWLYFDVVEGEWNAFNEILSRKSESLESQIPMLQKKILEEEESLVKRAEQLATEWDSLKPLSGSTECNHALKVCQTFATRVEKLEEDVKNVMQAKDALALPTKPIAHKLSSMKEEVHELSEVWTHLRAIWSEVDELAETPWAAINTKKVRRALEALVDEKLRDFPPKLKNYDAYIHVVAKLKSYLKYNGIITELKSPALKERHWEELRTRLRASWILHDLTLGSIWSSDMQKHESTFKDVILLAQGELALEEFLKKIKSTWEGYVLDLVNYHNKCQLIRGWDDLFSKLAEDSGSLGSMKMSPYYKVFATEATLWDEKLNKIREAFDLWIDVQRKWVYLEGVFMGSSDIRVLLPLEFGRFKSINTEFTTLMKRTEKTPKIADVMGFEGLVKGLERLVDLLTKVQKALGDYLEKQRAAFPRFYFIGDEDLLEIIGNSKDIVKIQKHLRKMFAGLAALQLQEEGSVISGMGSREGEEIAFVTPVSLKEGPKIHEWLSAVEKQMRVSLATELATALAELAQIPHKFGSQFLDWIAKFPAQLVLLAQQCAWTQAVEQTLGRSASLEPLLEELVQTLDCLATDIAKDLAPISRKKYEQLITELVHQRDVTRLLIASKIADPEDFGWRKQTRLYFRENEPDLLKRLQIQIANASFSYGWEYLGIAEKLVQTELTDRCYLALSQALEHKMGGNPFGPAGTGKTETVKALGCQLGRYTVVFNCDENFDVQAVGRILVGLCECGAFGCFDEFNRLEERILSAVSQQIQAIQVALSRNETAEINGKTARIDPNMGIFVTMNPGYAGRSNLPDNLKQLFRSIAMITPDRELIAQVNLFSQGYKSAERLAAKVVPLFKLCAEQLSQQSHYDFGLRALKAVLVSAGNLKRATPVPAELDKQGEERFEQDVLIRSTCETVVPKLVSADTPLYYSLLTDVFPGCQYQPLELEDLRTQIAKVCRQQQLVAAGPWVDKLVQLFQIQLISHGVMMVGPSGSSKSTACRVLLQAMQMVDQIEGVSYVLDPKAISKEELFGALEPTTREWTDGLFTGILRRIIENVRGEASKRHWIIFDGDVDPEWVENLNSLLDDNKLFTLPNGERLALPSNVRIMFEVDGLRYATPATVSRCGMVWFSEETLTTDMVLQHYLAQLCDVPLDLQERELLRNLAKPAAELPGLAVQRECAKLLAKYMLADPARFWADSENPSAPKNSNKNESNSISNNASGEDAPLVVKLLRVAQKQFHIMDFLPMQALTSMFALLNKGISDIVTSNATAPAPLDSQAQSQFVKSRLLYACMWGFGGSMKLNDREQFSNTAAALATDIAVPNTASTSTALLDYFPDVESGGAWHLWKGQVPELEVEHHKVGSPDVVIPTVDTVRHVEVLTSWLAEHRPLILCGPPGSGKTMTLSSTLNSFPDFELASLNFSSATTPELVLKTFDTYCEYKRTPKGVVLRPSALSKWLVVFCDEINLPAADTYGTQKVVTFMRQLTEQGGFWRPSDHAWVTLERIQFVGACNPPTDPGRVPLTHRFLRHCPLLLVDFPSKSSLLQIYGTFNRALLKIVPMLRGFAEPLTSAMVEFYQESQRRFTPDIQAHYVYSPRELSRWVRALHEGLKASEGATLDDLMRLFVHEALRLFQDRLVELDERKWTDTAIDQTVLKYFPNLNPDAIRRPILFSNWLHKEYTCVDRPTLRNFVKARLKTFNEEELDVPLVIFNEVLDHILRIDRVFRQPQGHALLIGVSGGGKTVLSRFVAWMNGLSIFTIKVNNRYTARDFDDDLRYVMKKAGCKEEKICFIFDESNVLDSAFLERMNTLLAGGEVPGLFEAEEYTNLIHQIKETANKKGLMLNTEDELYRWFVSQVRTNLHIVFTMNPASPDFHNRSATSPALFNRCVLDWFGEWSEEALFQVGQEFTKTVQDLDNAEWEPPVNMPFGNFEMPETLTHRDAVISSVVYIHTTVEEANKRLLKKQGRHNYLTPRHYLDFIKHLVNLIHEKREDLEEQQRHLNKGLNKLKETETTVKELQESLTLKERELQQKNKEAEEKLKQMVHDQQSAEEKKKESEVLQQKLDTQNKEINQRRESALERLSKVQPLVEEAQNAVSDIKQQHLVEIRSMARPPDPVQKTMQAVLVMLTGQAQDWAGIRKAIMDPGFIPSILEFNSRKITPQIRDTMKKDYLSDPKWTFEIVNRASRACGPLVKWIRAQLEYSEILDQVKPLEREVEELAVKANTLQKQQSELKNTIQSLETQISKYKEEYALLISEASNIKNESMRVKEKVERSINLLQKLSGESLRWNEQRTQFQLRMATVVGDVILCAAFLSYSGYFDQFFRSSLNKQWKERLRACGIAFKEDLSVVEYLSTPDERLSWTAHNLPADELCQENALMLQKFNRYPLVIDPSGQAAEFLMSKFKDRRITKTSFLDTAFMKNLEAALRFGTPLLVQDVESMDPVLNPVLNKEIYKKGGRVLIKLGDQEVDFSPSFVIFLSTRDPLAHFTPDLCSRVTFVNFTVTPSSLQAQCLFEILKTEAPETFQRRQSLIKDQGEFQVKLRNLEKSLLQALSESSGNLLDNDKIIQTLETLKNDSTRIMEQVQQADVIMKEIEQVSSKYHQLSAACSALYFTLDQLDHVNFLYLFSLNFFFRIFHDVLHNNPHLQGITDPNARIPLLFSDIFQVTFERVARSLLHADHMSLALRFAQIRLKIQNSVPSSCSSSSGPPSASASPSSSAQLSASTPTGVTLDADEFDFLLRGGESMKGQVNTNLDMLTSLQQKCLAELELLPAFSSTQPHLTGNKGAWNEFLKSASAESCVPHCWKNTNSNSTNNNNSNSVSDEFRKLLVLKAFRPDRLLAGATLFVGLVFDDAHFLELSGLDMQEIFAKQSIAQEPLMLCSTPGFDASGRIDSLSSSLNKKCVSLAMGSDEGFDMAEKTVFSAAKEGSWVLLKNVHLAARWLNKLEKKLYSLAPHKDFRLFMTAEIHPKLPANLLRLSRVLVVEPPPGIKANLHRTWSLLPRTPSGPKQKAHIYLLLAWLHAVVQERLVYAPLGWTKGFEFNESDLRVAISVVDHWVDSKAQGRTALPPAEVPWLAIRTLLGQCVYGGKIDNPFDQRLLDSFLEHLFTPKAFEPDFVPTLATQALVLPAEQAWLDWVEKLPEQKPTWLGLPDNAESFLLSTRAKDTLQNLYKLQSIEDDSAEDESADSTQQQQPHQTSSSKGEGTTTDVRPSWMVRMKESVVHWLKVVPEKLDHLPEKQGAIEDPMWRFFKREIAFGSRMLKTVRTDLELTRDVCAGTEKQTNHSRSLMTDISKGIVPKSWKRFAIPAYVNINAWVSDFAARIHQLQKVQASTDFSKMTLWLGGLFNPEAFITATRQLAAQSNKWSLETLVMHTAVLDSQHMSKPEDSGGVRNSFLVSGLTLEGADYSTGTLQLTEQPWQKLPLVQFLWLPQDRPLAQSNATLPFPLYINDTRMEVLSTIKLKVGKVPQQAWFQRSVAVTTWRNQ